MYKRQVPSLLQDYGSTYASGTATHRLTLYRHNSGALVFGAGTVQWSWGLDSNHDRGSAAPDVRMQQATVNLFADMSVQPATLQPGLVAATASTDTVAPVSTIATPTASANKMCIRDRSYYAPAGRYAADGCLLYTSRCV